MIYFCSRLENDLVNFLKSLKKVYVEWHLYCTAKPQSYSTLNTHKEALFQGFFVLCGTFYQTWILRLLIHFEWKRTPQKFCVPKT